MVGGGGGELVIDTPPLPPPQAESEKMAAHIWGGCAREWTTDRAFLIWRHRSKGDRRLSTHHGVLIKMSAKKEGVISRDERERLIRRSALMQSVERTLNLPNLALNLPPQCSCCSRLGQIKRAGHCCRVILGSHGCYSQDNGIGKLFIERGCCYSETCGHSRCLTSAVRSRPGGQVIPSALLSCWKQRYSLYHLFSRSTRSHGAIQSEF